MPIPPAALPLLLAALAAAPRAARAAEKTGYLMDNLCVDRPCLEADGTPKTGPCTPDGSNTYYSPETHSAWCLLLPYCEVTGFSLMSAEPGADGVHKVVLRMAGEEAHAAVVNYINTTNDGYRQTLETKEAFPLVTVVYEDAALAVASDGVPEVSAAVVRDPWTDNPAAPYGGGDTTQALCGSPADADVEGNNLCFRSDVQVSVDDVKGAIVIESGGCPDHENMAGGQGKKANNQKMPDGMEVSTPAKAPAPGCADACGPCGADPCAACWADPCAADPCAADPCAAAAGCWADPCAADPCAADPCAAVAGYGADPCAAAAGCGADSCASSGGRKLSDCAADPCAADPCAAAAGCWADPCAADPCAATAGCWADPCAANPCAASPCAADPCAATAGCWADPCAANPCAANPCAANPCAANPCAANPCAANPCAAAASVCGYEDDHEQGHESGKKVGTYTPTYQHYTMRIPQDPILSGAKPITDNVVGIMTNGVILDTHEQTWSYDVCGGHSDMKHQYHYHLPPICFLESMGIDVPESGGDWWISDDGNEVRAYAEMSAQWPATGKPSPVLGYARDGFPILGLYDSSGTLQRSKAFGGDLDECNGQDDGNGYAYYLTAEPPFLPTCLMGEIGSFAYAPTDKACPQKGITNEVVGLAAPAPAPGAGDSAEDDDNASARARIAVAWFAALVGAVISSI